MRVIAIARKFVLQFAVAVLLLSASFAQQLQLTGLDGKSVTVAAADLKAMPRDSVSVDQPEHKRLGEVQWRAAFRLAGTSASALTIGYCLLITG